VPDVTHFSTPLGEVPLDREFIHALVKNKFVVRNSPYHDFEHSVQIQLPLLQYTLEKFTLVPIIVGQTDRKTIAEAAAALLALVDDSTLVIASSDFTHYGKDYGYVPFTDDIPESLSKLDMGAFDLIKKKDPAGFLDYCDKTGDTICGKYPVAILLSMLPAGSEVSLLNYTTSGKITGSYTASVSYISASVTGSWGGRPAAAAAKTPDAAKSPDSAQSELSDQDKKDLLKLARKTLELYLKTKKIPSAEDTGVKITPAMKKVMGAFVTLHDSRGELRGCIGEIRPSRPLFEAVMAHAVNAGVRDYRFSPVTPDELASLDFEISALTPPAPVASYKDIVIGRHGMTLSKDGRSAVFLPQVAPEQGWTLEETLKHLSVKAGLRPDDWKDGAFFTVFEAIVFGEKDRGKKH
jgi:AmmeMemoRadiSam system protein A/AmmeMemoRadiSam system protein B